MKKFIAMLMKANLQRLSVQMIQNQKASCKKKSTLKCEDCEYTTKQEQVKSYIERRISVTTVVNLAQETHEKWGHLSCVWSGLLYGVLLKPL